MQNNTARQRAVEKRRQAEEKLEQDLYVEGVIAALLDKKEKNGGKLPHRETQVAIERLERRNIQMNRNQIQYQMKSYQKSLTQKTPSIVSLQNSQTKCSPLGMNGPEDESGFSPLDPSMVFKTSTQTGATSKNTLATSQPSIGRPKGTTEDNLRTKNETERECLESVCQKFDNLKKIKKQMDHHKFISIIADTKAEYRLPKLDISPETVRSRVK